MKIGIFGGSFNPPHIGHFLAVQYAFSIGEFDRIYVIPCGNHPFRKKIIPFQYRFEMCCLAFKAYNVFVSDIENSEEVSYTINTVEKLKSIISEEIEDFSIHLLLGEDCVDNMDEWKDADRLKEMVDIFVFPRDHDSGICPNVSSTLIRYMISLDLDVSSFVPAKVVRYLKEKNFYKETGL